MWQWPISIAVCLGFRLSVKIMHKTKPKCSNYTIFALWQAVNIYCNKMALVYTSILYFYPQPLVLLLAAGHFLCKRSPVID